MLVLEWLWAQICSGEGAALNNLLETFEVLDLLRFYCNQSYT